MNIEYADMSLYYFQNMSVWNWDPIKSSTHCFQNMNMMETETPLGLPLVCIPMEWGNDPSCKLRFICCEATLFSCLCLYVQDTIRMHVDYLALWCASNLHCWIFWLVTTPFWMFRPQLFNRHVAIRWSQNASTVADRHMFDFSVQTCLPDTLYILWSD